LVTIVLRLVSFIFFGASYVFTDPRYKTTALLMSPCQKCGYSPMRFERGSEGDYVFICDKCQIEWTLNSSVQPSKK
jgi:hypothetical protein